MAITVSVILMIYMCVSDRAVREHRRLQAAQPPGRQKSLESLRWAPHLLQVNISAIQQSFWWVERLQVAAASQDLNPSWRMSSVCVRAARLIVKTSWSRFKHPCNPIFKWQRFACVLNLWKIIQEHSNHADTESRQLPCLGKKQLHKQSFQLHGIIFVSQSFILSQKYWDESLEFGYKHCLW